MTKRSPDAAMQRDLVMWAIFRALAAIAVIFVVLMLLADVLWIVSPRFVESLFR